MAVKSIVRNLFVSGALALSVGAVCGRPVSASDKKSPAECLKCKDCIESFMEDFLPLGDLNQDRIKCVVDYAKCLEDVILFSGLDTNKCKNQRENCLDKVEQEANSLQQELESKYQDFVSMQEEL